MSELPPDQFNERLSDLVVSALQNQTPATHIAAELVRSAYAVVLGSGISTEDLMVELAVIMAEMNNCQQRDHLH